ncbi:hypothetical protein GCM10022233_80010 [Streptomyces shaanxiensis]|uniref:Enolase C-terminal domain-containing protein n=1 Tax=Streptomyces shaanxiensis TaxID=653357 RepID=A0ABP7WBU2_9ACTN
MYMNIQNDDRHYWGGLRRTRELAAVCEGFGIALSMHSNSHLGISLAAMAHVAAAIRNLDHSCDTHYPWNSADDVIVPDVLELRDGAAEVPPPDRGSAWSSTTTPSTGCTGSTSTRGCAHATTPGTSGGSNRSTNSGCRAGD